MNIETELENQIAVSSWIDQNLTGAYSFDNENESWSHSCFDLVVEHHAAVISLCKTQLYGAAFALLRVEFEALVRGLWLKHVASSKEINRFKKDKVDPSEWEKDGERCLDALKAGLYPAEVELRMWHKGTEDTNKNHNAQHAYMNAVYGTTKIPTGNVAVVRLTLPYDIDEGDLITVMLMRYDKGLPIIGEDKFFAICSISFTFSNVSEYQKNMDGAGVITSQGAKLVAKPSSNANNNKQYINGISIHDLGEVSVKADSAFKAHQILAVFDLDNVENLDPSDKSKELYEYNSNVEFEAWMSYNRASSKSTRPYRTENSHTNIQNKLDTWEDLSSTSFYAIDRIGWFLSPSVEYTMVGANISPPLIKYSPGNPFYLTEI